MVYLIKHIFARVWALWTVVVFALSLFVVWLIYKLRNPRTEYRRIAVFQQMSGKWMAAFFFLCGFRVKIFGKEHFDLVSSKACIVVANHRSFMDICVLTPTIPRPHKTIGKSGFMKVPILNTIYGSMTILLDRKLVASRLKSYTHMKNLLEQGISICIYPEGTRNRSQDLLLPFQRGAFALSIDTKSAIIPTIVVGSDNAIHAKKPFYVLPSTIHVYFLSPVEPLEGEQEQQLRKRVYNIMYTSYKKKVNKGFLSAEA